jgi:hypothetical protein
LQQSGNGSSHCDGFCTVQEAAQILHRSPQRVRAYIQETDPHAKYNLQKATKARGRWKISRQEVETLLQERQKRKQTRRLETKAQALTERVEHIKYVLRMFQLDDTMDRSLRGHILAALHEKLEITHKKLVNTRKQLYTLTGQSTT